MALGKKNKEEIKDMYSSYDIGSGDILISGLGFGILTLWLAQKEGVNSITVVEFSKEVIEMFLASNELPSNVTIINEDINNFASEKEYDSLLLDHYEIPDADECLANMQYICKKISHKKFWAWPLELMFLVKIGFFFNQVTEDNWNSFTSTYFPEERSLEDLDFKSVKRYIDIWHSNYYKH